MGDPRLDGHHLSVSRYDLYDAAVDELLDARGPITAAVDLLVRRPANGRGIRAEPLPPGGTYALVNLADGYRHVLRVGINALGRAPENDLVLPVTCISRRHCVVLVHATGGCEVYDTASRNGTYVNRRRVTRVDLLPGDVLDLCGEQFLIAWEGPERELIHSGAPQETSIMGVIASGMAD